MSFDYKIISHEKPSSFESEQYKKLRTNIEYLSIKKDYQVISITSSLSNEGKTYTILNLATVYAQSTTKTLIIDMDLRKSNVHRAFKIPNDKGLTNCVSKDFNVDDVIVQINKYLYVLPAGPSFPYPSELLQSTRVKEIIDDLRTKFEKIVIDTPPVTLFSDSKIVSNFSDGTLFVIASKKTKIEIAKSALSQLSMSNVDIMGAILTQVPLKEIYYGKEYYYMSYLDY